MRESGLAPKRSFVKSRHCIKLRTWSKIYMKLTRHFCEGFVKGLGSWQDVEKKSATCNANALPDLVV